MVNIRNSILSHLPPEEEEGKGTLELMNEGIVASQREMPPVLSNLIREYLSSSIASIREECFNMVKLLKETQSEVNRLQALIEQNEIDEVKEIIQTIKNSGVDINLCLLTIETDISLCYKRTVNVNNLNYNLPNPDASMRVPYYLSESVLNLKWMDYKFTPENIVSY